MRATKVLIYVPRRDILRHGLMNIYLEKDIIYYLLFEDVRFRAAKHDADRKQKCL